ncbi:MAG: sulfatase-like hydrolase/transferase [Bacteroidetes bacterium]|nr:sulfatase-like hydrolase/transferase [Bacteroidota bacterium]
MIDFFDRKNGVFWIALICGFYPLVFYYSNNFYAVNSFGHLGYFILFFIGLSLAGFALIELFFTVKKDLRKYRPHTLFIAVLMITATLMSYAIKLRLQKKLLVVIFVVSILLSIKFHDRFRKLAILILIMAVLPFFNCFLKIYELNKNMPWVELSADIKGIEFKEIPNIYMIQPDGYVDETLMEGLLYKHQTDFYNWLRANNFKLYDNFRSNYPASVPSNASMFSMQHHYYGETFFSDLEMPKGREMISGQNTTNYILQNNGYKTYFLAQDEYFQQNLKGGSFDHYNISKEEIPYFTIGDERERVLHNDLKEVLNDKTNKPKFVFIEKLLPHHIHFVKQENQIEAERKEYIAKIEEVNLWLRKTVNMINDADPKAIVIVLADHGGWVGMTSYPDMYTTTDEANIRSIFSSIAAIKWNGHLKDGYDTELRSTVNLFRVLFASLAQNADYLQQMEDNSSYNLHMESWYRKSVYKVLDDKGKTVFIQYKK